MSLVIRLCNLLPQTAVYGDRGAAMYPAIAGILFSLVLTFLNVRVSVAEIWVCTQPNGSTLYTDEPQRERSCEKLEPGSQLIYLPPRIWANVPAADTPYEEQEAIEADATPAPRIEEQTVFPSDAAEGYDAHLDTFWGWDENPVLVYTYVTRPFGVPFLRHRHTGDFSGKPWTQHGIQHNIPLFRQSGSLTPPKHFRENSIRAGARTAQPRSVSPASSTHVRGDSVGAAAAATQAPSSGFSPHVRR
jgi:hypothetical protein